MTQSGLWENAVREARQQLERTAGGGLPERFDVLVETTRARLEGVELEGIALLDLIVGAYLGQFVPGLCDDMSARGWGLYKQLVEEYQKGEHKNPREIFNLSFALRREYDRFSREEWSTRASTHARLGLPSDVQF